MDNYMDPMDYTMDGPQPGQQQNDAAHRYQCQQPQQPPQFGMSFGTPTREGNRYDPVHESSGWYQDPNNSHQSRPTYSPGSHFPQWAASSAPHQNWNSYQNIQQPGPPPPDFSSYRASQNYLSMPWAEVRSRAGLDPHSFVYGAQAVPMTGNSTSETSPPRGNATQASGPLNANSPHTSIAPVYPAYPERDAQMARALRTQRQLVNAAAFEPGRPQEDAAPRPSGMQILMEQRLASGMPRNNPYAHPAPPSSSLPGSRRRGNRTNESGSGSGPSFAWSDSDEEDDLSPNSEHYRIYRHAQMLLNGDFGDERTLAMIRGQLATKTKRVPSKEAIKALEKVDIKTLTGDDLTCSICYNELGVKNPEGLVETPIRLPKCKHLFGNICIKKWFEDNDTCPYCRDKLPSEVSIRKNNGYEMFREQRQRYLSGVRPARGNLAPRFGSSSEDSSSSSRPPIASSQPHQDEEDYNPFRTGVDSWGYSPTRTSGGESPEYRLRQRARGRVGSARTAHTLGRPTSVGSARWMSATASSQDPFAQRTQFPPPVDQNWSPNAPVRSITPGLNTQTSPTRPPNANSIDVSPTRPPFSHSNSAPSVEASPPVAVGSGLSPRTGQSDFWFEGGTWREARDRSSSGSDLPVNPASALNNAQRPNVSLPLSQLLANVPGTQPHNENTNTHNNPGSGGSPTSRWSR